MRTQTVTAGSISEPIYDVSLGDVITLTGTGTVQTTTASAQDIKNGLATWTNCTLTNGQGRCFNNNVHVRVSCTSGTCVLSISDSTPNEFLAYLLN